MRVYPFETALLNKLTIEQLEDRLAKLEKMGKETGAKLKAGIKGETVTYVMKHGRLENVGRIEAAYNVQRHAWAVTKIALEERIANI